MKEQIREYKAIIELMEGMHKMDIVLEYQRKLKELQNEKL